MSDNKKDDKPVYNRKASIAAAMANAPAEDKGLGGHARDLGLSALSSAVAVPELAVGLADIPTGGRVGKFLENEGGALGFRPRETKEAIANWKTDRSQEQLQEFTDAEGLGSKLNYARKNPSLVANTVVESLAPMLAGGVVGRGLGAVAPKLSPVVAGALGEGTVGAGLSAEQIRQQTDDGLLTGKQAGLAAATGVTTAGFGFAGGKLAQKAGIGDVDTLLSGGARNAGGAQNKNFARRGAEGALREGFLEELPQSVSEQILQNEALGRPLDEGVTDAAALGLLSGAALGAGAGVYARNRGPATDDITPTEDMGQEAPRLGLPNPNRPGGGNQLGYQGELSDPNNPNWIENSNPDYFNRGQGPDANGMRNLNPDPGLGFGGAAGFRTSPDGQTFANDDQYNAYLDQQRAQATANRDAGASDVTDITPVPKGYDEFGRDPALPAPKDFVVGPDGTARTAGDVNTTLQNEQQARIDERARRARGEFVDRTPVPLKPSEQMGLDANKGSLSSAAVIAVDSGASDVGNQMRDVAAQEPQMSAWQSGMTDRLANADQSSEVYGRLSQAINNEPASAPEKARLMREANEIPKRDADIKQIKPNTRVLDESLARTRAYTPEGNEVQAQWDVVDASDLVTSNTDSFTANPDFPVSRQPRDRTRASAQQQVNDIASKLQPNILGESPDVSTGAPFVGANDNVVDSGNGRSMAIRKVYQENGEKAQAYRQFVNEQASKFGLDTDAVNMMQSPVLVRRNISDMNRDEFARAANKPTAARMSTTEQAASDAKNLPDASLLSFDAEGSMSLYQSQQYLKNFIAGMPKTEQGSLMDKDGLLSREGQSRIEAAIVQDAYNNSKIVSAISEKLDSNTTNVLRAITDKAPQISQINNDMKNGDVHSNTLARDIGDAAQAYMDIKNSGKDINDYLSQDNLFDDGLTDGAKEILSVLSDNKRSAKAIGEDIQERINAITGKGNPKQGGLSFDDETDAPNVMSNEPAPKQTPTNPQAATQLTDDNPTVNIPAPKKAPRELSDKAMVREMQKPTANSAEADYKAALNLSEGQNLGQIIMTSGRAFDDAVVKSTSNDTVTIEATVDGKRSTHNYPYSTIDSAINNAKSYADKQAAIAKNGGKAVAPSKEMQPSKSYSQVQSEVADEMDITTNEDGEYDITDEQFDTMEGRVRERMEAEESQNKPQSNVEQSETVAASPIKPPQSPVVKSETVSETKKLAAKSESKSEPKTIEPKSGEMKFSRAAGSSETAELKDLVVVHNITGKGVLAAAELGGLAAPSIAVIRANISDFTGYGEITLIADPLFLDGKDMPTYDADIYSPRQPRAQNDINRKRFDAFDDSLTGRKYGLRAPDMRSLEMSDGEYQFMRSDAVQYQFLESIGKAPKLKNKAVNPLIKAAAKLESSRYDLFNDPKFMAIATKNANQEIEKAGETAKARAEFKGQKYVDDSDSLREIYFDADGNLDRNLARSFLDKVLSYRESDGKDFGQLRLDVSEKMRSSLMQRRYEKWANDQFNALSDGKRLPNGETRSGTRKYKPYNLENVVKEMTRELNNGESFNYGAGNVRSVYAGELKTLSDIRAKRDKIISKDDFAAIKEESNKVFADALDNLKPYYKHDADGWNYDNDVSSAIAAGQKEIKEIFGNSKEAKTIIDNLTYYLSRLPTEYFEAKAQRAVQFGEFDTAIVPKDADPEAVKVLKDAGVKIRRYDSKADGDKNRVIAQQTKLMFSKPDSERTTGTPNEKVKGSTETTKQQVINKLSEKFGKETVQSLIDKGLLDIKNLSDFVKNGKLTIPSDVDGLYHNGKATLIADNLTDDMIIPTFLHELGGHGGLQEMMDAKAYNSLMKEFDDMVASGDPLAMQAKAMADKASRNQNEANDEYLPYLVTLAARQQGKQGKVAGMINRMAMAIRSWLRNKLGVPIKINAQDILGLAERMVNEREKLASQANPNSPEFEGIKNSKQQFSRAGGMNDQFDPANLARETKNRFYDWVSSAPPGKLSWWHKTIGTMYNLSERNPAFKPVFDTTEKFINDVSFYAAKASEFAPKLLPQLDSLRDITKSAIGAKDNDALSKPIFEGTLIWGRDLDGKAVLIDDWRKKTMAASMQDRLTMLKNAGRITPAQEAKLTGLNNIQANRFINGIIDEEVNAGLVWTDSELRSKFDLADDQIALYREFRAATDNSLDSLTRSDMLRRLGKEAAEIETQVMEAGTLREAVSIIEGYINTLSQATPKKEKALKKTLTDIKQSAGRTNQLIDDGYAPLSRFGQYTVDVVDADGNREYFGMFESAYDARKMEEDMKALYNDGTYTISRGALSKEEFKMFAGVTPETAELFGEMLGLDATGDKAADDAFQEYLRRTKNNRSAMKRLMHRKGIKGYSEDVGRVLASFIYSNARHSSAALNMGNLDRSIGDIPKGEGQLKDAAVKLAQYIKNPQEEGQLIRGWMFAQYLGGSIASAAVNITQPIAVSFPYLSQFGGAVKAASELSRSSSDWAKTLKSGNADPFEADLRDAIDKAEADGTLSPQEIHNLMKQASGKNPLNSGDGTKFGNTKAAAQNTLSRISLGWGSLFSLAEQLNRRITFVAAYRMAKDQGMDNPAQFATDSIKQTQFVYNKASRMNWGRGAVGGTLMTFKTYTVSYMELMHRLWTQGEKGSVERAQGRKASMLMLATLFLLGGGGGLPFMEDIEDVIDGASQIMGYNLSTRKERQDFLDSVFGEMLGDFLESGVSGIPGTPTDVSGRLGMDNLIPGTGVFKERPNNTRDALELLGPAGDFVARVGGGSREVLKGVVSTDARMIGRGALEVAPVAIRNAVKGAGMLTTGTYKDTKGYKVSDVTPIDAAFKAIGFQPKSVSEIQEANWLGQSSTSYYNLRASKIRALWAQGVSEKNPSKVADARAAVKDWNKKNPEQPIIVKPTDITRRVRNMNLDKSERVTKMAPKSMRAQMAADFQKVRDGV